MPNSNNSTGVPPGAWEPYFRRAQIDTEKLDAAKSARAKATSMGNYLSRNLNREVPIAINGRTGRAKLCAREVRRNQRLYHFEITWDEPGPAAPPAESSDNPPCVPQNLSAHAAGGPEGHPIQAMESPAMANALEAQGNSEGGDRGDGSGQAGGNALEW